MSRDVREDLGDESIGEEVRPQAGDALLAPRAHLDRDAVLIREPAEQLPAGEQRLVDDDDVVIARRVLRHRAQGAHRNGQERRVQAVGF